MDDVQEYVEKKQWKYRVVDSDNGPELNIEVCPFCRNTDYHFYINSKTGQYICHHGACSQSGSMYTLKKYLGDILPLTSVRELYKEEEDGELVIHKEYFPQSIEAHRYLLNNVDALKYLFGRKFSREAISNFVLGLWEDNGIKWVGFPYFREGKLHNIKFRSIPPADKSFRRIKGGKSLLFNEDILKEKLDEIVITEGESDAISLWSMGYKNVVGATVGAGGVETTWIDKLDRIPRVYFVYDRDIAGTKGAYKFADRLGLERCFNIDLPPTVKDLNEFFMKGGTLNDFLAFKKQARPFDVEDVKSIAAIMGDLMKSLYLDDEEESGLTLPWKRIERLTGKFAPGDLVVLGAKPGVGKTMMALNFLYYYASKGYPSLIFELEMRPERLVPRLIGHILNKDSKLVNNMKDLAAAYQRIKDYPLYFAYKYRKLNWQIVEDTIRMCAKRYGLRFIVFDNIHFLSRGDDPTREVSLMINNLKLLAEELAITILAIARPRKMGKNAVIDSEDLAWSADIEGDSDFIILLHREKVKDVEKDNRTTEGIFMPRTLVRIDKARWDKGGDCFLVAKDAQCRFEED